LSSNPFWFHCIEVDEPRRLLRHTAKQGMALQVKYAGFGVVDPQIRLDFECLGLRLRGGGCVLQGVSGEFLCWRILLSWLICC
jgi:hypothetical protein